MLAYWASMIVEPLSLVEVIIIQVIVIDSTVHHVTAETQGRRRISSVKDQLKDAHIMFFDNDLPLKFRLHFQTLFLPPTLQSYTVLNTQGSN